MEGREGPVLSGGINYTLVNFSENEGNTVTEGGEWRRSR